MYRARDAVDNEEWLETLRDAAASLDLSEGTDATAADLFLSTVPEAERSKAAAVAASLYAATLIESERRSQGAVADAVGVSRLAVQHRWKDVLREAGFDPPEW